MTEAPVPSLLERKIAAARPRADPLVMSAERALGLAFARVSEQALNLPLRIVAVTPAEQTGTEIVETLPDLALLAMLEGPKDGLGLAVIDASALSVWIEMLTLGRLGSAGPVQRRPTRTDAVMVASVIDSVLVQLETLLAAQDEVIWAGGFRYAAYLPDARPLGLMLDAPSYRVFRLTLGFGQPVSGSVAERLGEVALIFPAAGQGPAPVGMSDNPEVLDAVAASRLAEAGREEIWAQALARAVAHATTEVVAVLGRVSLSLSDVLALDVGVSLPLPMAALQMVQLEGVGGTLLCRGQIGQGNGRRALRLYAGVDADEPLYALPATVSEVVPAAAQPLERTVPRGQGARRDLSGAADPILPAGVDMPEAQDGRGGEVPADARASLARTSMAG